MSFDDDGIPYGRTNRVCFDDYGVPRKPRVHISRDNVVYRDLDIQSIPTSSYVVTITPSTIHKKEKKNESIQKAPDVPNTKPKD